jgi:hypothetical protein
MIWVSAPRGQVVSTYLIVPGIYSLKSKSPPCVLPMMHFFRKERLEVRS